MDLQFNAFLTHIGSRHSLPVQELQNWDFATAGQGSDPQGSAVSPKAQAGQQCGTTELSHRCHQV